MSEVNTDFMRNYAFDITNRYADQNKVGKKRGHQHRLLERQ